MLFMLMMPKSKISYMSLFVKALQGSVEGDMIEVVPSIAPVTTEQLWVEKYAPSSFTELLSDEKTNREVV